MMKRGFHVSEEPARSDAALYWSAVLAATGLLSIFHAPPDEPRAVQSTQPVAHETPAPEPTPARSIETQVSAALLLPEGT